MNKCNKLHEITCDGFIIILLCTFSKETNYRLLINVENFIQLSFRLPEIYSEQAEKMKKRQLTKLQKCYDSCALHFGTSFHCPVSLCEVPFNLPGQMH